MLGLGEVSAGVEGGALVPTGEVVFTWSTGRCWRKGEGVSDTAGETGGEMGKTGEISGDAVFVAGRASASHLRKLLQRFLKSVLGVKGVGGRRSRMRKPGEG